MAFELRFIILSTGKSKIETQIWRHQCNIKKVNVIYQIINLAWFDLFSYLGPIGTQINQTSFDFVTLSLSSYELKHIHFHWHEHYSYYVHKYFLICIHLPRNWSSDLLRGPSHQWILPTFHRIKLYLPILCVKRTGLRRCSCRDKNPCFSFFDKPVWYTSRCVDYFLKRFSEE